MYLLDQRKYFQLRGGFTNLLLPILTGTSWINEEGIKITQKMEKRTSCSLVLFTSFPKLHFIQSKHTSFYASPIFKAIQTHFRHLPIDKHYKCKSQTKKFLPHALTTDTNIFNRNKREIISYIHFLGGFLAIDLPAICSDFTSISGQHTNLTHLDHGISKLVHP